MNSGPIFISPTNPAGFYSLFVELSISLPLRGIKLVRARGGHYPILIDSEYKESLASRLTYQANSIANNPELAFILLVGIKLLRTIKCFLNAYNLNTLSNHLIMSMSRKSQRVTFGGLHFCLLLLSKTLLA
jgi:hypothetical protein